MIHLNQKTYLCEKYKEYFDVDYDELSRAVSDITYQKYQYLVSLAINKKLNDMRRELILLGVKV